MNKLLISAVAVALAFSPAAFAQGGAQTDTSFAAADSDKSGDVSMTELVLLYPDYDQANFDALDGDKSGGLNETEYGAVEGGPDSLVEDSDTDDDAPAAETPAN